MSGLTILPIRKKSIGCSTQCSIVQKTLSYPHEYFLTPRVIASDKSIQPIVISPIQKR